MTTHRIPLPSGDAVYVTPVSGTCDVHALTDDAACDAILRGLEAPGGVNVCSACVTRARDHLGRKLGRIP